MSVGRFGPTLTPDGATFRLWVPAAGKVAIVTDTAHMMEKDSSGWFVAEVAAASAGMRYHYRIDDELTYRTRRHPINAMMCPAGANLSTTAVSVGRQSTGAGGHGMKRSS